MAVVNAKRIGYLRAVAPSGEPPIIPPSPTAKSMWKKLAIEGLVKTYALIPHHYGRSPEGQRAVEEFDANLSESCRQVLNAVRAGEPRVGVMKGMTTVVAAGLVGFVEGTSRYKLTEAGEKLADPIDEDGYFTKSGNLVRVIGVSTSGKEVGLLQVERLEGESAGKRMLIDREAFVRKADWAAYLGG